MASGSNGSTRKRASRARPKRKPRVVAPNQSDHAIAILLINEFAHFEKPI